MRRPLTTGLFVLALLLGGLPAARADEQRCFAETRRCLGGELLAYWNRHGGLPVFGYPLTDRISERNRDTGRDHPTQWLERTRFELHPENQAPYDILLGRIGAEALAERGTDWQTLPRAAGPQAGCRWFAETGHNVCDQEAGAGFKSYWESHGLEFDGRAGSAPAESLALFGLPLSEPGMETNENGDTVLTQWFERARFEWHPANPRAFRVLLGLLGKEGRKLPLLQHEISLPAGAAARFEVFGLREKMQANTMRLDWTTTGLPAGAKVWIRTADFGDPFDGPVEITLDPTTPIGTYPIEITAGMPSESWTAKATLTVTACQPTEPGDIRLTAEADEFPLRMGGSPPGSPIHGLIAAPIIICGDEPLQARATITEVA
ncbi:MAG TPA: hypothetical protein VGE07_22080, partial [Herpetosiphonaceae bacterium]